MMEQIFYVTKIDNININMAHCYKKLYIFGLIKQSWWNINGFSEWN